MTGTMSEGEITQRTMKTYYEIAAEGQAAMREPGCRNEGPLLQLVSD
jgi:hypothetical protein